MYYLLNLIYFPFSWSNPSYIHIFLLLDLHFCCFINEGRIKFIRHFSFQLLLAYFCWLFLFDWCPSRSLASLVSNVIVIEPLQHEKIILHFQFGQLLNLNNKFITSTILSIPNFVNALAKTLRLNWYSY